MKLFKKKYKGLLIEHDGKKCTKFEIDGIPYGMGITEVKITIIGGEKPLVEIRGRLDTLKLITEHCNILGRENKDE